MGLWFVQKKCFKFSVENFEVSSSSRRMFAVEAPPQDRAVLQPRLEPAAETGSEEDRGGGVSTHSLRAVWTPWDWKNHHSYRSNTTGAGQYLKLGPFQRTASPRLRCWPANPTLSPSGPPDLPLSAREPSSGVHTFQQCCRPHLQPPPLQRIPARCKFGSSQCIL